MRANANLAPISKPHKIIKKDEFLTADMSNGYDAVAETFMRVRSPIIGCATIQKWTAALPTGGTILDIGAGSGHPLTAALVDDGFDVYAIDASPKMVKALRQHLPNVKTACESAEQSDFFNRKFDGVMAVGLIFLLSEGSQRKLIGSMADAVKAGGRLLFSSPRETGAWDDVLTGRRSLSLGVETYLRIIAKLGLDLKNQYVDEGGAHYYDVYKPKSHA